MKTTSEETSLLLSSRSHEANSNEASSNSSFIDIENKSDESNKSDEKTTVSVLWKIVETVLDWSPFIIAQSLLSPSSSSSNLSVTMVFLWAFLAAAGLLLYKFWKQKKKLKKYSSSSYKPASIDLGQFLLFGLLFAVSHLFFGKSSAGEENDFLLILWCNPLTSGGMCFIMWASIYIRHRPFVYDYVEPEMPPYVWKRLSSKKWFRDILLKASKFWVNLTAWMTLLASIQPLLVTCYGGVYNDIPRFMDTLGSWLSLSQLVILSYGLYETDEPKRKKASTIKRVQEVKQHGLTEKQRQLYDNIGKKEGKEVLDDRVHILSSSSLSQLDTAAQVLADAFQKDEMIHDFLPTKEEKCSFFSASLKAISYFHKVLVCYDDSQTQPNHHHENKVPCCVMACIPVHSKSREEIEVFHSYDSWVIHGFTDSENTDSSSTTFPLPGDGMVQLAELRKKSKHGLMTKKNNNNPFLYIAFFGANPAYRGKGYGRILLNYIIRVSELHNLPLVLETCGRFNITNYEKYGFKVVDSVEGLDDYVLMIMRP